MNTHARITDEAGEPPLFFIFNCHTTCSLLPQTPYLPEPLMGSIVPLFGNARALRWIGAERYKRAMYGRFYASRVEQGSPARRKLHGLKRDARVDSPNMFTNEQPG